MMLSYLYDIFIYPIELIIELIYSFAQRMLHSPGLAIIAVSLVVNILVLPLYNKSDAMQEEERKRQADMKQWLDHIKKTFKGNERFMMQSTYYRQMNYKPIYALRGSFSLLLQIPFFMAAYHFLSNLTQLQGTSFLFIKDLGQPDGLLKIGALSINLLPVAMTAINIISGAIYTKGSTVKEKIQLYGIALIFLVLLYTSPAGLVFYWTLNNLFSLFKNIFTKVVSNPKKVLAICLAVIGVIACPYLMITRSNNSYVRIALFCALLVILELPLILLLLSRKKEKKKILEKSAPTKGLYITSTLFVAVLLGGLISSAVLSASPVEFMTACSPVSLLAHNLCIFAGFFLVWMTVFYFLAGKKGKVIIEALMFSLGMIFTLNFMLVGRNFGIMSALFRYDNSLSYEKFEKLLSIGGSLLLLAGGCILAYKAPKIAKNISLVLLIGGVALSCINTVKMAKEVNTIQAAKASDEEKIGKENQPYRIQLNKDGKNVVVFMLDRFISGYVPYILEERPELQQQLDGFTYYPNTASFGPCTNYGAPALFGGYEYTPYEINKRADEKLRDKHDEALLVMPTIFSQENYEVSIYDPPYAGYQSIPDLSIFDGLSGTKAFNLRGQFTDQISDDYLNGFASIQKRNLATYCIFKSIPYPAQKVFYDGGRYYRPAINDFLSDEYVDNYAVLCSLPSITDVKDGTGNSFVMMENEATHAPTLLQEPEYTPSIDITSNPQANIHKNSISGDQIDLTNERQLTHYHIDIASFIELGKWFDYLRENDVYDNTRIILVSDHGFNLGLFNFWDFDGTNKCMDGYNALLMVKDFNATGFEVDNSFMTNADVPWLAAKGLIEDPVNPYTGKPIDDSAKAEPQIITTSANVTAVGNERNTFDTSDGYWVSVHDDIFDEENWSVIKPGEK